MNTFNLIYKKIYLDIDNVRAWCRPQIYPHVSHTELLFKAT